MPISINDLFSEEAHVMILIVVKNILFISAVYGDLYENVKHYFKIYLLRQWKPIYKGEKPNHISQIVPIKELFTYAGHPTQ